ncbi:Transmembrane protein 32 protein [Neofusicoccum parvum]|uniref:Transmembrane protein 32 protein n=1 Tax=Neofusicoccum parvum TaxID=310453 RepID=A0ACB5RZI7_9PEZI|nr:Transmembrane protein 32 protein [Neofusicoccum parvum]
MTFLSNLLVAVGLLFLSHAVYSAHEHSALHSTPSHASSPSIPSLPPDIVAETLLSVLAVAAGIVLSSPPLKPIQWSRWAGEAEREEARRRIGRGKKVAAGEAPGGNPFAWITEDRVGFWDGRGKRQDFANWVREGATN